MTINNTGAGTHDNDEVVLQYWLELTTTRCDGLF